MRAEQFIEAARAARTGHALDEVARLTYRALGEGLLDDVAASAVIEAAHARRGALKASSRPGPAAAVLSRRRQVSPDRQRSIQRRRAIAASGAIPSSIAADFTQGEVAVLSVIARECQRRGGACDLCLDAIAAQAGVSRSVVQRALRHGRRLGILSVQERRRAGAKSETNILRILDPSWRTWLRIGCQNGRSSNIRDLDSEKKAESPVMSGTRLYRTGGMASGKPSNQMKITTRRHVV